MKRQPWGCLFLLRRLGSNQRPSGYEPDELPLLYFAMWLQMYSKIYYVQNNFYCVTFAGLS